MSEYVLWDMFTLSEEQRNIIGWVVTIGISFGVSALTVLTMYCIYSLYRIIKNFSKNYWCFDNWVIYINIMRVQYTHIKRWDTFTNCECVGGDIV